MGLDEFFSSFQDQLQRLTAEVSQLRDDVRSTTGPISYTLADAAAKMGLSRETLYERCRAGKIPYTQDGKGGSMLVLRADLEKYLKDNRNGSASEKPVFKLPRVVSKETRVVIARAKRGKED